MDIPVHRKRLSGDLEITCPGLGNQCSSSVCGGAVILEIILSGMATPIDIGYSYSLNAGSPEILSIVLRKFKSGYRPLDC